MRRAALARRARIVIAGYPMWVIVRGIDRAAKPHVCEDRFRASLIEVDRYRLA